MDCGNGSVDGTKEMDWKDGRSVESVEAWRELSSWRRMIKSSSALEALMPTLRNEHVWSP